jgi:dTDP-4-amino-4,6-dideoxygalactose transaminase
MQFIDLAEQYHRLKDQIDSNIQKVLDHGKFLMGPEITGLEKALAEFAGVKHVISCSNGTDALLMPLMAWGIGKGDAVFAPTFTYFATAEVVALLGATPVFVDIDPDTYNIDPDGLEKAIEKVKREGVLKPRVVIPVDLFGLPAEYDRIQSISRKYGLKVLEDAAQGFGGIYRGRVAGSFGEAAATSFFPAKPLGCYGDGGAIFTDDDETAAVLKSLRVHGQGSDKYDNIRVGLNARLDTIQAAILLPKLAAFKQEIELRNKVAAKYSAGLKNLVKTPVIPSDCISTWAQYSVMAKDNSERARLQNQLKEAGIPTMVYYPTPLHLQTAFKGLGYQKGDFPVAEAACERIFSLPMHPYLKDEDIERIVEIIKAAAC